MSKKDWRFHLPELPPGFEYRDDTLEGAAVPDIVGGTRIPGGELIAWARKSPEGEQEYYLSAIGIQHGTRVYVNAPEEFIKLVAARLWMGLAEEPYQE